ncbi:MAG TPA: zinc-dependent peptidase [Cyclobacteriaceae bacterium]|nr:zinc-dependent peptidase [Cyclobacteriaceae bacterium]
MEVILEFAFFIGIFLWMFVLPAVRSQRWFKKILFYYFPRFLRPLSPRLKPINVYYKKLTSEERKRFEWRVFYFINTTDIEFRHFNMSQLVNYNEVRYLIASIATQMSLFLTEDCYDAFNKIIIYPDQYYSPITGQYHKGETNPGAGYIVLSWTSLQTGFANKADGINLLMHELAHALWLENELFEYDIFDAEALQNYKIIASRVMNEVTKNNSGFLRSYAFTNKEEFFAVAVENFFERPEKFKSSLPELYFILAKLLKQDPAVLAS